MEYSEDRPQSLPLTRRQALALMGAGAAVLGLATLSGCGCSRDTTQDVDPIEVWTPPYDWSALMTNPQGRKFYYPNGQLSSKVGIDVSDYDHEIDWAQVAADGIEFAFVRVGYRGYTQGGIMEDGQCMANLQGARANGLPLGAYFFSSAINENEAREEAQFVLDKLAGMPLEYPIVYDQEQVPDESGRANNLTVAQYTANAKAFCETINAAGYDAMIYGNQHHFGLLNLDELASWPLWYAEYGVSEPTGRVDFSMWQYSESGTVAGIDTGVDMNILFVVEDEA